VDVLRGLAHAHSRGIIHRDIKPANILIGSDGTAKIADFGIARPQNSSMTAVGAMMGTPNYMPPEQVLGQPLVPRADIFSAGVMLFEMLTATKPFAASDVTVVLHNIVRQTPPLVGDLNPRVPPEVSDLVRTMMSKNPLDRPTASEALDRLEDITKAPHATSMASASQAMWRRPIRKPLGAAIIAGAIIATAVPSAMIIAAIDSTPSVTISSEKLQEFEAKRRAIAEAHALLAAGRYAESVTRYEAYLQKYPYSTSALEGKQLAQELLNEQRTMRSDSTSQRRQSRRDEDISPSQLLDRLKRLFRRK